MTCSMCAQAVEAAIRNLDPSGSRILDVKVSLTTDTVMVEWHEDDDDDDISTPSVPPTVDEEIPPTPSTAGASVGRRRPINEAVLTDAIESVGYQVVGVLSSSRSRSRPTRGGRSATKPGQAPAASSSGDPLLPLHHTTDVQPQQQHDAVQARWDRLQQRQATKVRQRRQAFVLSVIFAAPVAILTMVLPHVAPSWSDRLQSTRLVVASAFALSIQSLLLWILATLTQTLCGWEFYKGSYYNFKARRAGMDVLVALGTTASYLYALYGMVADSALEPSHNHHQHGDTHDTTHFFETATTLIAFVLAGKWMQAAAVQRTSSALSQLMALQAKTALKITPFKDRQNFHPLKDPYKEATVPVEDVRPGDLVKVLPGSSIPADGQVVFGQVSVDESMLTGESLPVWKTTGSIVLGGTLCVESSTQDIEAESLSSHRRRDPLSMAVPSSPAVGAAFVHVTGVGSATALSQIIQLVTDAQTASASTPIQNFADTIASVFVPAVALLSVVTTVVWYSLCRTGIVPPEWYEQSMHESAFTFSLLFGIAVLVISCPCALGLATPTAIMVRGVVVIGTNNRW